MSFQVPFAVLHFIVISLALREWMAMPSSDAQR